MLNKKVDKIAYSKCGEGKKFAKSLINDIHFRLGDVYIQLNDKKKALESYKKHLNNRKHGIYSNITKQEVKKEIHLLEKSM